MKSRHQKKGLEDDMDGCKLSCHINALVYCSIQYKGRICVTYVYFPSNETI